MGEVSRTRDTRLERDVAVRVLPEELFEDPERRTGVSEQGSDPLFYSRVYRSPSTT
jgi:hypothetical protein